MAEEKRAESKKAEPETKPEDLARHERAAEVRDRCGYEGRLTAEALIALEPMLREPIEERYIETLPAMTGKPYVSTGLKSAQVQVDRMNEVLGGTHWRALAHFEDGAKLARVWVVVGNELQWVRLDEDTGDLLPYTTVSVPALVTENAERNPIHQGAIGELKEAEVLIARDGWGGHGRGSAPGDIHKGAETNALKRVLARVGPGCDVYRLDYDEDTHPPSAEAPPQAGPRRTRGKPQGQAPPAQDPGPEQEGPPAQDPGAATPEELEEAIEDMLTEPAASDQERTLRKAANEGMKALGAEPDKRLQELQGAKGERGLQGLITRIENAGGS